MRILKRALSVLVMSMAAISTAQATPEVVKIDLDCATYYTVGSFRLPMLTLPAIRGEFVFAEGTRADGRREGQGSLVIASRFVRPARSEARAIYNPSSKNLVLVGRSDLEGVLNVGGVSRIRLKLKSGTRSITVPLEAHCGLSQVEEN